MKCLKILKITAVFSLILCRLAIASDSGYCNTENTCEWKVENGVLTISGSGEIQNYGWMNAPWFSSSSYSRVDIEEGITRVGNWAFGDLGNVNINLPKSINSIGTGSFLNVRSNLVIPQGVTTIPSRSLERTTGIIFIPESVISISDDAFSKGSTGQTAIVTYCPKTIVSKCGDNAQGYERDGDNIVLFDKNGKLQGIYGSYDDFTEGKVISGIYNQKDQKGNILAQYDGQGNMLKSYNYGTDGSIFIYDSNGRLVGIQGKRIFTVDEATALVSGNGKNTFSIKYR